MQPTTASEPGEFSRPCGKITLKDSDQYTKLNYMYAFVRKRHLHVKWLRFTDGTWSKFALNLTFIRVNLKASLFDCHLESLRSDRPNNLLSLLVSKPVCGDNFQYEKMYQGGFVVIQYSRDLTWYFKSGTFTILFQVDTLLEGRTETKEDFIPPGESMGFSFPFTYASGRQHDTIYSYFKGVFTHVLYVMIHVHKGFWDCLDVSIHDGPTRYAPNRRKLTSGIYIYLVL